MSTFTVAFVSIFAVVGPLGAVPTFAALTAGRSRDEVHRIAARGTMIGAIVLGAFALLGGSLLEGMGVSAPAFQVAGGFLLFLTALDMLRGKPPACGCGPGDVAAARQREDIAIVPVAIPLLAGPGSMATVMSLISRDAGATNLLAVLTAIAATFAIAYPVLGAASLIQRLLGASTLTVVQRVLGLVIAALSIQMVVTALLALLACARNA